MAWVQRIEVYLIRRARSRTGLIAVHVLDHLERQFPDKRIRWDDYRFRVTLPDETTALEILSCMFVSAL